MCDALQNASRVLGMRVKPLRRTSLGRPPGSMIDLGGTPGHVAWLEATDEAFEAIAACRSIDDMPELHCRHADRGHVG